MNRGLEDSMLQKYEPTSLVWIKIAAPNRYEVRADDMTRALRALGVRRKVTKRIAWAMFNALAAYLLHRKQAVIGGDSERLFLSQLAQGEFATHESVFPFVCCALRVERFHQLDERLVMGWLQAAAQVALALLGARLVGVGAR